jgi:hypothetical protein
MQRLAIIGGLLASLAGVVWALQGVGILPGSFMTGDSTWTVIGVITLVAGAALVVWGLRSGHA